VGLKAHPPRRSSDEAPSLWRRSAGAAHRIATYVASEAPVLELRGITKQFPGVLANDRVDFDLRRGEVHALLGENGAGKSTLMNVLYGLYHPDDGEILVSGEAVRMSSPREAIARGIGMVHQHFMLIPVMTVAENIVLGIEPRHDGVLLDYGAAQERVSDIAGTFGFAVNPAAYVQDITVGQQQRVEILKALYRNADILILDEPTAVLTPQEADELFGILRNLTREGMSIIFITHKLNEVLDIADRVTVLRRGKVVDTLATAGATEEQLARLMVGREVLLRVEKGVPHPGEPLLRVDDLHVLDDRGLEKVRGVSLEVHEGEILAIAGVDGNGQTELIDAITGLRNPERGSVRVGAVDVTKDSAHRHFEIGVGHIPEDRQRRGLILDFSIAENVALHDFRKPPASRLGWLFPGRLVEHARRLIDEFDVRGGSPRTPAASLSGGNQQKVILAREIDRDPRVLVAAQPTRGLDVGAIEFVHRRLVAERDEGRGVLLVSLELEEVLSLADRILVIYEGRIVGEFPPTASEEELGVAMTGGGRREGAIT
jgi:general nucleoside transport system ATP-binding protein